MVSHKDDRGIFVEILLFDPIDKFTYLFIRAGIYIGISVFKFISEKLTGISDGHMGLDGKKGKVKRLISRPEFFKGFFCI